MGQNASSRIYLYSIDLRMCPQGKNLGTDSDQLLLKLNLQDQMVSGTRKSHRMRVGEES